MIGLRAISEAGQEWVTDNVASEGWQWLGDVLWGEERMMADVAQGAADDGMTKKDLEFIRDSNGLPY